MDIDEETKRDIEYEFEHFLKYLFEHYNIVNKEPFHDISNRICTFFEKRE